MLKLDAVNEMLEALHEAPVSALDTDAVSPAGQAERVLDRVSRRIQGQGWHLNTEKDVTLIAADVTKVAVVISGDGAWTAATKTLTKAAAFASYTWVSGDQLSITAGTDVTAGWYEIASKTSDNAIVLKDEISSSDQTDITTDVIGWENALSITSDIIAVDAAAASGVIDVTLRNSMLYDKDSNTFSFSDDMNVDLVRELDFTHLSEWLQAYIVAAAAVDYQDFIVGGRVKDSTLMRKMTNALREASAENLRMADINILASEQHQRMRGMSVHYDRRY